MRWDGQTVEDFKRLSEITGQENQYATASKKPAVLNLKAGRKLIKAMQKYGGSKDNVIDLSKNRTDPLMGDDGNSQDPEIVNSQHPEIANYEYYVNNRRRHNI